MGHCAQRCSGGQNVTVNHYLVFRQQQGASVSVGCKYKIAPISWSFLVPAMPFVPKRDRGLGCKTLTSAWTQGRFPWAMTGAFSSE